eukprot:TRINITY_DN23172_c0_g3_i1.p1 TRINITY_DN23172_c0_g3~~TRINITY_DN23172_c0_g3_i1.p1  ORF type:complete len:1380 (+),score=319.16 TRINITY_DN23172_c0_g3_i1:206-4345(+)
MDEAERPSTSSGKRRRDDGGSADGRIRCCCFYAPPGLAKQLRPFLTKAEVFIESYSVLVSKHPFKLLVLYSLVLIIFLAAAWRDVEVDTSLASLIRADGQAMRNQEAYEKALEKRGQPDLAETGQVSWGWPRPTTLTSRRLEAADEVVLAERFDFATSLHHGSNASGHWEYEDDRYRRLVEEPETVVFKRRLTILYEAVEGNVLDERVLREVRDFELRLLGLPGWQRLCSEDVAREYRHLCDPGESLGAYAWPSEVEPSTSLIGTRWLSFVFDGRGGEPMAVPAMFAYLLQSTHQLVDLRRMLPAGYTPPSIGVVGGQRQSDVPPAKALRTRYTFALDITDESTSAAALTAARKEAEDRFAQLIRDEVYPLVAELADVENPQRMRTFFYGDAISDLEVELALRSDVLYSIGSGTIVALYMWWQTGSLWTTLFCMSLLFTAVPLAYVFTPALKTTMTSAVSLFLVAGIGSQIVFVFQDIWTKSGMTTRPLAVADRLRWTFQRAGLNCLATSLTSGASFFALFASGLQSLREFGLFMGLCVLFVWLLVVLFLPSLLVLLEACRRRRRRDKQPGDDGQEMGLAAVVPSAPGAVTVVISSVDSKMSKAKKTCGEAGMLALMRLIEACPLAMLAVAAVSWVTFLIGFAATVSVDGEIPVLFPEGHNQVDAARLQKEFHAVSPAGNEAPTRQGAACSVNVSQAEQEAAEASIANATPCVLNWCEAPPDMSYGSVNGSSGACWRSDVKALSSGASSGWSVDGCSSLRVSSRLAALEAASAHGNWSATWADAVQNMTGLDNGTAISSALRLLPVPRELPALVLEDWATGTVQTARFFDMGNVSFSLPSGSGEACGVEVVCYAGTRACTLEDWRPFWRYEAGEGTFDSSFGRRLEGGPEDVFEEVPDLEELVPPSADALVPDRRLSSSVAEAAGIVPLHRRIEVTILFGLRAAPSSPLLGASQAEWSFDPGFEPFDPWAQRAMYAMCKDLPTDRRVLSQNCWINSFRSWVLSEDSRGRFPTREFEPRLLEWADTTVEAPSNLWMINELVRAASLSFVVDVADDMAALATLDYKGKWDTWVNSRNAAAHVTANRAFHTAEAWARAEAQTAVVDTTISTVLLMFLVMCVGSLAFTRDPVLCLLVMAPVLGTICGGGFVLTCLLGWKIGAIEIIAVLACLSTTASNALSVVQLYADEEGDKDNISGLGNQRGPTQGKRKQGECMFCGDAGCSKCKAGLEPVEDDEACMACGGDGCGKCKAEKAKLEQPPSDDERRRRRIRAMLLRIGGPTISSVVCTFVCGVFLSLCTLRLFSKLGAIVISLSILSALASLVVLPALLLMVGPGIEPCVVRWSEQLAEFRQNAGGRAGESSSEALAGGGAPEAEDEAASSA